MVHEEVSYLIRRYTLEKGYRVVAFEEEDGESVIQNLNESRFGYNLPTIHFNVLKPLSSYCDVILARYQEGQFEALALSTLGHRNGFKDLDRDLLDEVGQTCRENIVEMGEDISYDDMSYPIIELVEVHRRDLKSVEMDPLECLAGASGKSEVTVITHALGFHTGEVASYGPLGRNGRAWYLKQILRRIDETEEDMIEAIEEAGVSLPHVFFGVLSGLGTALGLRYLLSWLGVQGGEFYFWTDYCGATAVCLTAVFTRRIRADSGLQSGVATIIYLFCLYGLISYIGYNISIWTGVNAVILIFISIVIGDMAEMR